MDEIKLVKYLSGELAADELREVELWLELPENRTEFEKIKQLWEHTPNLENSDLFSADKSWHGMKTKINASVTKESKSRSIALIQYAAAASVILLLGFAGFYFFSNKTHNETTQYSAGLTKQQEPVILPDGTKVYLNRNTNISFQKDFNITNRYVTLTGEAYFDVAKNPAKPFIILTATAEIRVVGTSFNVLAYANSDSVLVSVESGIVEMYSSIDKTSKIKLTVGNAGTYLKSNKKLISHNSFDSNQIAWKTNQLNFKNANLEYVITALKHAYGKDFVIPAEKYKKCRLTVNFNNQSLDTIIRVLQETLGVTVSEQGETYLISGPGC